MAFQQQNKQDLGKEKQKSSVSNNGTQVRKNAPKQVVGALTKNCSMHAVSKMSTLEKLPRGRPDVGVFNHTPLLKHMFGIKWQDYYATFPTILLALLEVLKPRKDL